MESLSANHINPFLMAAKKVFCDVCCIDLQMQKPELKEAVFLEDSWVIIIGVTGEMRGQVLFGMREQDACMIASKMCMTEVKQVDDFASSALGELGNMIMGNAATVFSSNRIGIDITPPTLSHGKVAFKTNFTKSLCIPMTFGNSRVELFLALK